MNIAMRIVSHRGLLTSPRGPVVPVAGRVPSLLPFSMEYHTEVSLETLAEADPCSLADASRLRAVYARVLDADPQAPLDDVARLHALFDVALDHGLVSVVVHYVQEVCLR